LFIRSQRETVFNCTGADEEERKIPIHLPAGSLGSGKTTTLKHVLENKEQLKLAVLVSDVAAINIDAKLIASQLGGGTTRPCTGVTPAAHGNSGGGTLVGLGR